MLVRSSLPLSLLLIACDPIVDFDVVVEVSPEAQVSLDSDHPAQVVVEVAEGSEDPGYLTLLATLCEDTADTLSFTSHGGWVGCAVPMTAKAWILPVEEDRVGEVVCGEGEGILAVDVEGVDPGAQGNLFADKDPEASAATCPSGQDEITLVLPAP